MLKKDGYREPTSHVAYVSTGKIPPSHLGGDAQMRHDAYWRLAGLVEEHFGEVPATVADIYHEILGPMGLSSSDTIALLRGAKKEGYLK